MRNIVALIGIFFSFCVSSLILQKTTKNNIIICTATILNLRHIPKKITLVTHLFRYQLSCLLAHVSVLAVHVYNR